MPSKTESKTKGEIMRQHELTEKKSELLNCIKESMWTELEFNEKDIYRKEDLSMSDALILIYRELKRFNDRVERQEIQEIQREANMQGWERAEEEERARKKRRKREKKLKSLQRKLTA
jgi:hypothetical protein|tara:strand:- start:512 stop:865 length:354 start_codon:yes stop_codon:yes gene_type:complete